MTTISGDQLFLALARMDPEVVRAIFALADKAVATERAYAQRRSDLLLDALGLVQQVEGDAAEARHQGETARADDLERFTTAMRAEIESGLERVTETLELKQ